MLVGITRIYLIKKNLQVNSITEGSNSGKADVHVRLLAPSTLDDGSEDRIGVRGQASTEIGVLGLANKSNSGEGRLLEAVVSAGHILDQDVHEVGPLISGQFDCCDRNNQRSGSIPSSGIGCQGLERELLNLCLRLGGNLVDPSALHFTELVLVSEGKGILQGDTGGNTDVRRAFFAGQLLA